jgi:O-antigen/teichoic acid export membrane protein
LKRYGEINSVKSATLANLTAQALGAAGQLLVLPVYLNSWGAASYGAWLICIGFLAYAALMDVGVAQSAATEVLLARGRDELLLASSWVGLAARFTFLMVALCALVAVLASPLLIAFAARAFPGIGNASHFVYGVILQSSLIVIFNLFITLARSLDRNGTSAWLSALTLAIEIILPAIAAFNDFPPSDAVLFIVFARMLGTFAIIAISIQALSALGMSYAQIKSRQAKYQMILKSSVAHLLYPASVSTYLQGTLVIIGAQVSLVASAAFGTARTISRVPFQLGYVYTRANLPRLSSVQAKMDEKEARAIVNSLSMVFLCVTLPLSVVFGCFGSVFQSTWTSGKLILPAEMFALLAGITVMHAYWNICISILISKNVHPKFTWILSIATIATMLALVLLKSLGAIVLGLAILEAILVIAGVIMLCKENMPIPVLSLWFKS